MRIAAAAAALAVLSTSACGGGGAGGPIGAMPPPVAPAVRVRTPIEHVIIAIQENRSFDDLFATFPGADGTTHGTISDGTTIPLKKVDLVEPCDFGHGWVGYVEDYDRGKMDRFDREGVGGKCRGTGAAGRRPYQYVSPSKIRPYWDLARRYVLADHLFQTQGSGSYTAHQDLIRGSTTIDASRSRSLVDAPSALPWGCDAPAGTTVSLLVWSGTILQKARGPFPCSNKFPASGAYYLTLRDLLDAKGVSWKYYSPPVKPGVGGYWNAFDTIAPVRYGGEWKTNVTRSEKLIFDDISRGKLPSVSWLIPDDTNSDHPSSASDTGPSWVASVVNAVGTSSYWKSTAIVVVWDDWGGFYDHVRPPSFDRWGGLGFRVPMLVVSAYARKGKSARDGYVSHTQYEFGSILKFVENTFALGRLKTTDERATSIGDSFDFSQPPRRFKWVGAKYSRRYFERQPPSGQPVDTQ